MYEYPKRFGDSGPEWVIDLESQDGNPYKLLKAIEKVMGDEKYAIEATNGEHFRNPEDCPYDGYERILDYILSMCPDIELRLRGRVIQQVYPCYSNEAFVTQKGKTVSIAKNHESRGTLL